MPVPGDDTGDPAAATRPLPSNVLECSVKRFRPVMPKGGSPQSTWPPTKEGQAPEDSCLGPQLRGDEPHSPCPRQGPGHHSPRPSYGTGFWQPEIVRHPCRLGGNGEGEQQSLGLSRAGTLPDPGSLGDMQPSTHLSPSPASLTKFSVWCGAHGPTPQPHLRERGRACGVTESLRGTLAARPPPGAPLRAGSPRAAAASAWLCRRG